MLKNSTIIKAIKSGSVSVSELADYLMRTYPVSTLCEELAEYIIEVERTEPIAISEEQFRQHFRILGTKVVDGEIVKENRGRKAGTKVVGGKVVTD